MWVALCFRRIGKCLSPVICIPNLQDLSSFGTKDRTEKLSGKMNTCNYVLLRAQIKAAESKNRKKFLGFELINYLFDAFSFHIVCYVWYFSSYTVYSIIFEKAISGSKHRLSLLLKVDERSFY